MKKVLLLACISAFLCAACSDDSSSQNDSEQCPNGDCNNPPGCEGDDCEEQPTCEGEDCEEPPICEGEDCGDPECDECTENEMKCADNDVLICKKNTDNCLKWSVQKTCDSGTFCNEELNDCGTCKETCDSATKRCELNGVAECTTDDHGCAVWNVTESCKDSEHCDETEFKCVPGCTNQCEPGQKQCNGNEIQTCVTSDDGCTNWQTSETCDPGMICTGDQPVCEYPCGPKDSEDCKPFSIVILPDTQNYTLNTGATGSDGSCKGTPSGCTKKCEAACLKNNNKKYQAQTQWIVDNKDEKNIKFVLHMGDIANDNCHYQYCIAKAAHEKLSSAGIPYVIATGNHEYKKGNSDTSYAARGRTLFSEHFNDNYIKSKYKDSSWFKGFFYTGSMYATFEIGKLKFAVLGLEYAPRKGVLCKADSIIQNELKDYHVILTTHANMSSQSLSTGKNKNCDYVQENDKTTRYCYFIGNTIHSSDTYLYAYTPFGVSGKEFYNELAARHSNVVLVASGHHCDIGRRDRKGFAGNTYHESLIDYQCESAKNDNKCDETKADNGNGWIRVLTIDPTKAENNVTAETISTNSAKNLICDAYKTEDVHNYTFTMDLTNQFTGSNYKYSTNNDISFGVREINSESAGNQNNPAIAMNRDTGTFVAVWEHAKTNDIAARIFCSGGCVDKVQFTVNAKTTGKQTKPDVAMDKDGNFVIVWEDDYDDNGYYEIFMRGFDASGKEIIPPKLVNSTGSGQQLTPAIAMAPNGNFVVAWEDQSADKTKPQIFIRGFDIKGNETFHDRNVMNSDVQIGPRVAPDIAMDKDGNFVVTWVDDTDNNGTTQIYAKGFNADGTDRLKYFTVNQVADGNQYEPAIGMNAEGSFFIAYNDANKQIKARGFDKDGKEIYSDQVISGSDAIVKNSAPVVCTADDGSAVFGWNAQHSSDSTDYKYEKNKGYSVGGDIHRIRLLKTDNSYSFVKNIEGREIDTAHNVTSGNQKSPALSCSSKGQHVFVFSDDDDYNNATEIFGRGYNGIN